MKIALTRSDSGTFDPVTKRYLWPPGVNATGRRMLFSGILHHSPFITGLACISVEIICWYYPFQKPNYVRLQWASSLITYPINFKETWLLLNMPEIP